MKKQLQLKLQKKYPGIFRNLWGDPRKTCMRWGIQCNDGWYDLIQEICQLIENHPQGEQAHASQIKQKFGTLRFYLDDVTMDLWDEVTKLESKSAFICQDCGKPGRTRSGGWLRTLCDGCQEKYQSKRNA